MKTSFPATITSTMPFSGNRAVPAQVNSLMVRRFGPLVEVRNRGALRLGSHSSGAHSVREQPAVVRMWHGECCRELSAHDARALAAQLVEAAACVESQNQDVR